MNGFEDEMIVQCEASYERGSVDSRICFNFKNTANRPNPLFFKGIVNTALSSGFGENDEEFWNGVASDEDLLEAWTSVSSEVKPEGVTLAGNISIYDLSADGLVEDVIAKKSRSSVIEVNGVSITIESVGFDEDGDGDFILRVDLSDLETEVVGVRVGFEDGIEEADWDIDIVDPERDGSHVRDLVVYDIEDGDLVSVEVRIGTIKFDNYSFGLTVPVSD
jgi:hypothetical protein